MRPQIDIPDFDKLVARYLTGTPVAHLAKELGVGPPVIARRLRLCGVQVRGRAEAHRLACGVTKEITARAIALYRSGSSAKAVGAATELSIDQVYGILRREKVARRDIADAKSLAWSALPSQEREKRGDEIRRRLKPYAGRPLSMKSKIAKALTIQLNGRQLGAFENPLAAMLRARGVKVTQQLAVGPYNIDLAIDEFRIAVEIERPKGPAHSSCRLARKRTKYILDRGWIVLFCFLRGIRQTIDPVAVADEVIAAAKLVGGDESARGKYGVIGGKRQMPPGLGSKLKDIARIPGL